MLNKRYQSQIGLQTAHIASLRFVIALLVLINVATWYGWTSAPDQLTVHVPPDLRTGASMKVHEIPAEDVFTFATHIFQRLQRWEQDGAKDYAARIFELQYFLTPRYQEALERDFRERFKSGQLRRARRGAQPLQDAAYEPDRVQVLGNSAWVVFLDLQISEWVEDLEIKQVPIRFPLRIVRLDIDREKNPWGLALDGYPEGLWPENLNDIRARERASGS
jgi:integrating conjugative element protein (TIGR03746 family)